jgi:death-on-curing protein
MSRIVPVTLNEFLLLIEYAQKYHASKNEPIPQVHESQYNNIKSCLETPFQTFGGKQLYKGFISKAAILFYLINKNHTLINGNKRLACLSLGYFCFKNRYRLLLSWEDFYLVAKEVTNSAPDRKDAIITALEATIKKYTKKGAPENL